MYSLPIKKCLHKKRCESQSKTFAFRTQPASSPVETITWQNSPAKLPGKTPRQISPAVPNGTFCREDFFVSFLFRFPARFTGLASYNRLTNL